MNILHQVGKPKYTQRAQRVHNTQHTLHKNKIKWNCRGWCRWRRRCSVCGIASIYVSTSGVSNTRAHRAPSQCERTTSTTIKFVPKIKLSTDMKMGLYATFYFVRGGVSFISSTFAEETELLADKYMCLIQIYMDIVSPQSTVRSHFMYTIDIENRSPVHKIDEALLFHFLFFFFILLFLSHRPTYARHFRYQRQFFTVEALCGDRIFISADVFV